MCATSLFLLVEEDRQVRLSRPTGHFHVFENGAGITKKSGAVSLFYCCTFLYHLLGLRQRMATTFKIGRKQCKRTIYLMLCLMCLCFSGTLYERTDLGHLRMHMRLLAIQMLRNNGIYVQPMHIIYSHLECTLVQEPSRMSPIHASHHMQSLLNSTPKPNFFTPPSQPKSS